MIIHKKKLLYALFCVFLMTSSAFGSPLDPEAIQILRRVLQKMVPEEITQEGIEGWSWATTAALIGAFEKKLPKVEVYEAVREQLKSPDELLKFINAHPDLASDLKAGLKESIERLVRGGQEEVQASLGHQVSGNLGTNRIKALLEPTKEEMAVLMGTKKIAQKVSTAVASSSPEALPPFLDRAFLQETAFAESIIPETQKSVFFHAVFPEFKISKDLFRSHPNEWMALLIEHGEFKVVSSTTTERGMQCYVLKSARAGGIEITFLSSSLNGNVQFTTIDLCYSLQEKGANSLSFYRHHLVYLDDTIGSHTILRDGKSVFEKVFH